VSGGVLRRFDSISDTGPYSRLYGYGYGYGNEWGSLHCKTARSVCMQSISAVRSLRPLSATHPRSESHCSQRYQPGPASHNPETVHLCYTGIRSAICEPIGQWTNVGKCAPGGVPHRVLYCTSGRHVAHSRTHNKRMRACIPGALSCLRSHHVESKRTSPHPRCDSLYCVRFDDDENGE